MMDESNEKHEVPDVAESPAADKGTKNVNTITKHEANEVNFSLSKLNLFDEKQLIAAENFLMKVMRSDKGGFKTINEGLAILMRAQDLQLPFSSCIEHIHVINGKTGIDIHIIKALLLRAGCTWRCLRDYQPLYEYTDSINVYNDNALPEYAIKCKSAKEANDKANIDLEKGITDNVYVYPVKWYKDFNDNVYKEYQLNFKTYGIAINRQQAQEIVKSGRIPVYRIPNQPIDFITEYEMERTINGKLNTKIGKFTYSEAKQAGLLEKDNYAKYPRVMVGHRAFTLVARDIASDILFGAMETTELKVLSGAELNAKDIASVEDVEAIEI